MPFRNQAQMRACFAQRARDLSAGKTPKWDCHKWAHETPKSVRRGQAYYSPRGASPKRKRKSSPRRFSPKRKRKTSPKRASPKRKTSPKRKRKIYSRK